MDLKVRQSIESPTAVSPIAPSCISVERVTVDEPVWTLYPWLKPVV